MTNDGKSVRRVVTALVLGSGLAGCRPVPSNPPEVWIPRDAATSMDTEPADEVWIPRADAVGSGLSYESPAPAQTRTRAQSPSDAAASRGANAS